MDISLIIDNGRPWSEVRSLAETADGLETYAVYVCDHFMGHTDDDTVSDEEPVLECDGMLLAALGGPLTTTVRLGTARPRRHLPAPGRGGRPADRGLDHVSGGRAIAGIGAGWQVNEHVAYGVDLPSPWSAVPTASRSTSRWCPPCCARGARPSYAGRYFTLTDAPNNPRPGRDQPPGAGRRRWGEAHDPDGRAVRRRVARLGHAGVLRGGNKSERLTAACRAIGRDPAEVRRATGYPFDAGGTDVAGRLEPYRAVCDEFVVFDWADRPLESTVADFTAALG